MSRSRSSGNKNPNFGDPFPGQSLFTYLKRKQKNLLQSSIFGSYHKEYNNSEIKDLNLPFQSNKTAHQLYHDKSYQQHTFSAQKNNKKIINNYSSNEYNSQAIITQRKGRQQAQYNFPYAKTITPRKMVTFANQLQKSQRRQNQSASGDYDQMNYSAKQKNQKKSFIQSISPMKQNCRNKQQNGLRESSFDQKKKTLTDTERFTKKQLNNSISILQSTLLDLVAQGKKFKRKAHQLFVQTKPFIEFCQFNMKNHSTIKQLSRYSAAEVKQQLRLLQHQLKKFQIDNANQTMEEFKINIQRHIDSLEAQLNDSFEKQLIRQVSKIKLQKNNQIDILRFQVQKLEKSLNLCQRKLQKAIQKTESLQQIKMNQQQILVEKFNLKCQDYQTKLSVYSMAMQEIQQQLAEYVNINKQLEKEAKSYRYQKQQIQRNFQQEKQNIISSRQQYLMNQIIILKEQYKKEVQQIQRSLQTKSDDQQIKMENFRVRQIQLQNQINVLRELNIQISRNQAESNAQMQKLNKKNQCLITDLHRMNQQLYQHWLALKDVRTLTQRLQIFDRFSVIYNDLSFNDRLFD